MRTRWLGLALAAVILGALGGAILAPPPASAISKEMIELQQQVAQILQAQQDMRSAIDTNNATMKTLVQQSIDSVTKMSGEMGSLQKVVQDVQANTGARLDTMTQQTQGLSDNLQDVQARVGKLSQQLNDVQNLLQSIDAKVSGGSTGAANSSSASYTPATPGASPVAGAGTAPHPMAPISADTLYQNALRDLTSGNYDLAHQEFSDYLTNFPSNDLASNAQFYLGEVAYAQNDFKGAIAAYDSVLVNYPKSFKLGASLMKKGLAEFELGMKASGTRDLREVVRRFPGSDEAKRAEAKLREIGPATAPSHSPR
ncbi:MAG TPA: tol-pal system protein YbgF [Candidatus Acidoferrales bacterium]|nr:tol-pal system protein YbgF [Candidatus Acidoferrales bacterium]